jgi:hypothetical protein
VPERVIKKLVAPTNDRFILATPCVIIVLAGISGGLGVVMAGVTARVVFPEEMKLEAVLGNVVSKVVGVYTADARLVIVRVMVVPATAVTLPLMLSVPE